MNLTLTWYQKAFAGLLFTSQLFIWPGRVEASPISGVTIYVVSSELTSSNSIYDRAAIHVVDGSGLDAIGRHTNLPDGTMWDANTFIPSLTNGPTDIGPTITFNLGSKYVLNSFRVWNFNSFRDLNGVPYTERSIRSVDISTSNDGASYANLGAFLFSQAPGTSDYLGELVSPFNVTAQFVRFNILSNYANDMTFGVGLSEIQFFGSSSPTSAPEPSTSLLFVTGLISLLIKKHSKGPWSHASRMPQG